MEIGTKGLRAFFIFIPHFKEKKSLKVSENNKNMKKTMTFAHKEKNLHKTGENWTKLHCEFWGKEKPLSCPCSQPSFMQICLPFHNRVFSAVSVWPLFVPLAQQTYWYSKFCNKPDDKVGISRLASLRPWNVKCISKF